MNAEPSPLLVEKLSSQCVKFTARKVQMENAYYVVATVPGQAKSRIGSFATRAQAREWIDAHAASWTPAKVDSPPVEEHSRSR